MAPTEGLRTRALTVADAEAGLRLSSEAGWNQTVLDWRMMLETAPAIGQVDDEGTLVASALVMPYDSRIGWIAMVLTTAAHQRRGLATRNLRWAIDVCVDRGLIAGLDATPAGREVYRPLGFRDLWPLTRWVRGKPAAQALATNSAIRPVAAGDLDDLAKIDADLLGASRDGLLGYLLRNRPQHAWLAVDGGKAAGFVLARAGRIALHVGPLMASDADIASALLERSLVDVEGQVSIDVPNHQTAFQRRLEALGFSQGRSFMRMINDDAASAGIPLTSFAIAGPELG